MTYRRRDELADVAAAVHVHALTQGGVFRREQLPVWGVDPGVLRTMVASRHWTRLRHGIYVNAHYLDAMSDDPQQRHVIDVAAVLLSAPDRASAFGPSAAVLHALPIPRGWPRRVDVVRPRGMDRRLAGEQTRRALDVPEVRVRDHRLDDLALTTRRGLSVVGKPLAAFSAAAEFSMEWAVATLDAAAWQDPQALAEMERMVPMWPALKGVGTLRRAIPLVRCGAQSPLESISRVRLLERHLPEPRLQRRFDDHLGLVGFTDMTWDDAKVIGECDGLEKYSTIDDVRAEKIREDRLRALGFVTVRWTWAEIMTNPDAVVGRIRAAMALQHRMR